MEAGMVSLQLKCQGIYRLLCVGGYIYDSIFRILCFSEWPNVQVSRSVYFQLIFSSKLIPDLEKLNTTSVLLAVSSAYASLPCKFKARRHKDYLHWNSWCGFAVFQINVRKLLNSQKVPEFKDTSNIFIFEWNVYTMFFSRLKRSVHRDKQKFVP